METQKGEWYFTVQCKECNAIIYFSHDPSKGKTAIAAYEDTTINVECPKCQAVNDYDRDDLVSRESE